MKIAFILGEFPAISQTFILNQITDLFDEGHSIKIFVNQNPHDKKIHPDVKDYNLKNYTFYFNIPKNKIIRILKAVYLIFTNFYKFPIKIFNSFNILKYKKEALCLRLFYATIFFLNKKFDKKFDIIHCHFGPVGILGVYLKEMGLIKGKLITSFHGYDVNSYPKINGKNVYVDLFKKGDYFTTNTNYTKKQVLKLGCNKKKIAILQVGIKMEKFKFYLRNIQSNKPIIILTVGRLCEKKGHEYSIKAISKLAKKYKNIKYIIAGAGLLEKKLKELVNELCIKNNVNFLGEVEEKEVLELYKRAHIFVLHSITTKEGDKEGQALVLQEAQATGLPVISTFHNGIPEGLINGKSGFLVPEKDVDLLVKKIEYFIEHPNILSKMGQYGRKFVEQKYDIKKLNKKLVKIYQSLANNDQR